MLQLILWVMGAIVLSAIPEESLIMSAYLWTASAFWILAIWLNIAATLRRLSDIGWSRWWYLIKIIPGVAVILEIVLLLMPTNSTYRRA